MLLSYCVILTPTQINGTLDLDLQCAAKILYPLTKFIWYNAFMRCFLCTIRLCVFLCVCSLIFGFADKALAAMNLRVNPVRGGSSLDFGRIEGDRQESREVRLRITSTDGHQYQVFQRMIEPLSNIQGERLSQGVLKSYTLAGANSSGSLYQPTPTVVSQGDQILYTSGSMGESDSFIVVYTIDSDRMDRGGQFLGKILYVVRPLGGAGTSQAILDVRLEADGNISVEVSGSRGHNALTLKTDAQALQQEYVQISIAQNNGRTVKAYLDMNEPLANENFEIFPKEALLFKVSGESRGKIYEPHFTALPIAQSLLFETQARQNTFYLNFSFDEDELGKSLAGNYRGRIKIHVESEGLNEQYPFDLAVDVAPLLELDVELPPGGIRFGKVLPESPAQLKELVVHVRNNTGRPYMVVQNIPTGLSNEQGHEMDAKYFTSKQELIEGQGKPAQTQFQPVNAQEQTVFVSDKKGSSATFKVYYRLRARQNVEPGDYSTAITLSLSEL